MANNWAQRGKEALATVSAVPEGYTRLGGARGEEITAFYQFNQPKTSGTKGVVINPEDTIKGTYAGSFENKKYGHTVHKVRTDKGLVALPNAAQLNNALKGVTEGTELVIVYKGKNTIKTGKFQGKQAHSFDVFAA
jgi:hypothetical protein